MDDPSVQANRKTVLLLDGSFSPEDWVVAFGYTYQKRTLRYDPNALRYFESELKVRTTSEDLLAVLIFFSKSQLFETCGAENSEIWFSLLLQLKKVPSLIFIDEEDFSR